MAKVKHILVDNMDPRLLVAKAGGVEGWHEMIGGEQYFVVEGCSQEALEAALVDEMVAKDATDRINATAKRKILDALAASDAGMVRAVEDILDALVAAALIKESDIPKIVLDKIAARVALRAKL